jgi:hypothetical protein
MTWTGCYFGGNIGGIFGRAHADFDLGELSSNNNSALLGAVKFGCDYQYAADGCLAFAICLMGQA